jgi:cysteinyl-tRNA synthetase
MPIRLHNTVSKQKELFEPINPERVTMYVCGPTVYSYAHIGNARPAVIFDTLFRVLKNRYSNVVYARNITDVDDKINKAAREQDVAISVITDKFADIYRQDMAALNVQSPSIEPKATDHIAEMIGMIEKLIANGHAYAAEGHVLFHVPSFADYGALSKRDMKEMIAGARVEVAPYKKDPADFVLWKPSDEDTPGWSSPWGRGRPGWHIECSAMIETHLGESIDIHGGGHDLQFPHHENEIAQSTCAHGGKLYVKYWMHNGFLNVEGDKMSKSIGNVLLVHDLIEQTPGEAIRLALITGHYRAPLDWTAAGLVEAKKKLDRLYGALEGLEHVTPAANTAAPEAFVSALEDDLNTPKAIAELFGLAKAANTATDETQKAVIKAQLLAAGDLIGLLQQSPSDWFNAAKSSADIDADKVEALIQARVSARQNKDFAEADRIRDELDAMGVELLDSREGTTWKAK